MKLGSVAALTLYVKDPLKTADFYGDLGFIVSKRSPEHATVRLNWFKIDFIGIASEEKDESKEDATAEPKGSGIYIDCSVANVDEFYESVVAKGMKPSSEPRDWPWGQREFVLRDPDGYKLVFFQKKG
jgi:uncharacterized glyoxalase superfamily protein PhnB